MYYYKILQRWRADLDDIFSAASNEHASWPPANVDHCLRAFPKRPELVKALAIELSEMIIDAEEDGNALLGKIAHPHQLGHLKWLVFALMEGGSSYLIEGGPGSGKTLVLGAIINALTRLQIDGVMDGVAAYGTHREFVLAQQAFSLEDRRKHMEMERTGKDISDDCKYIKQILGEDALTYIPRAEWAAIRSQEVRSQATAVAKLKKIILKKEGGDVFLEEHGDKLTQIAVLLSGEGTLVFDVDDSVMLLPLSKPSKSTSVEEQFSYSGDFGAGIPPQYVAEGLVAARRGADIGNSIQKHSAETKERVRVLLTTAQSILQQNFHGPIRTILQNVQAIIVDEGRNAAPAFQEAIALEKEAVNRGEEDPPLVFMASALSTTNEMGARPYADRYSPRLTIPECMEPGPDGRQVSPDMGAHLFPRKGGTLYPAGTIEALDQFLNEYFMDSPLTEKLGLPPPSECTTIVTVDTKDISEAVRRLRKEYAKRGIDAVVVPFKTSNAKGTGSANNKAPYSERIFQWMHDEKDAAHVKVLVAAPNDVSDALSIRTLRHVAIGTRVSRKNLLRIASRLQHANGHLQPGGERYRGYLLQQLFQSSNTRDTIFSLLGFADDEEHDSYIPLQVIRGSRGAALDKADSENLDTVSIPQNTNEMNQAQGQIIPQPEEVDTSITEEEDLPIASVLSSSAWDDLPIIAERAVGSWSDPATRLAFTNIVIEYLIPIRPRFMRQNWEAWDTRLRALMAENNYPTVMVQAVREQFIEGVKYESKMENERKREEIVPQKTKRLIGVSKEASDEPDPALLKSQEEEDAEREDELLAMEPDPEEIKEIAAARKKAAMQKRKKNFMQQS